MFVLQVDDWNAEDCEEREERGHGNYVECTAKLLIISVGKRGLNLTFLPGCANKKFKMRIKMQKTIRRAIYL